MRLLRYILFLAVLAVGMSAEAKTYAVRDIPNEQLQDSTRLFYNPDGIVSPGAAARINELLLDARRRSTAEVVAVAVDDIDGDIDDFATELFNTWGLGKKDNNNGVLLLVAKDRRKAVIRTGYGTEGVLPDIFASRILRNSMFPRFKDGDYDGGMLAGVSEINRLVTDPEAAAELRSALEEDDISGQTVFQTFSVISICAAVVMFIWFLIIYINCNDKHRALTDYEKYHELDKYQLVFWVVGFIFLGLPLVAAVPMWLVKRNMRNHKRNCPRCGNPMHKLDEETDNHYLTKPEDLEERIKSVDYDVWLCDNCGETDIYSFINKGSIYKECPYCHARTAKLSTARILREPTSRSEGVGEKEYMCLNCHRTNRKQYKIPRKDDDTAAAVAIGAALGSSRRGGGFGGGFGGGGFGGGLTGGGGASGGW